MKTKSIRLIYSAGLLAFLASALAEAAFAQDAQGGPTASGGGAQPSATVSPADSSASPSGSAQTPPKKKHRKKRKKKPVPQDPAQAPGASDPSSPGKSG
jgi:hypothetical protein